MIDAVVSPTVTGFDREAWDRCFSDCLEGWDYLLATERAGLEGFAWYYLGLSENGRLAAAVPAFVTAYRLDTTVQGLAKRFTDWLDRRWPGLMSLPMLCLGSPTTETCRVGFAPEVAPEDQARLLGLLLAEAERLAARLNIGLVSAKDVPASQYELWRRGGPEFLYMAGLATAVLDVGEGGFEAYLARLSKATRKDVRRKLRRSAELRIELRDSVDDALPQMMTLYRATHARSDLQFEELTADYFSGVLTGLGERAACVLYWLGERLIGFNLLLRDKRRLIDKFFGMDPELGRVHSLYVVSWMTNVRLCLEWGIPCYQSGQAGYEIKRRLGSRLEANRIYFRHQKAWANAMLAGIAKLVSPDNYDSHMRIEGRP